MNEPTGNEASIIDMAVDIAFDWRDVEKANIDTWDFKSYEMDEKVCIILCISEYYHSLLLLLHRQCLFL